MGSQGRYKAGPPPAASRSTSGSGLLSRLAMTRRDRVPSSHVGTAAGISEEPPNLSLVRDLLVGFTPQRRVETTPIAEIRVIVGLYGGGGHRYLEPPGRCDFGIGFARVGPTGCQGLKTAIRVCLARARAKGQYALAPRCLVDPPSRRALREQGKDGPDSCCAPIHDVDHGLIPRRGGFLGKLCLYLFTEVCGDVGLGGYLLGLRRCVSDRFPKMHNLDGAPIG